MDQDFDGIPGTPDDVYATSFLLDRLAPDSLTVNPVETTVYHINCVNEHGSSGADALVIVRPTLTFFANPRTIDLGESTVLTWQAEHVVSCEGSGGWSGMQSVVGQQVVSPDVPQNKIPIAILDGVLCVGAISSYLPGDYHHSHNAPPNKYFSMTWGLKAQREYV